MNLVEVWFSIIERQAIHRGSYRSVADLNAKIRAFITGWNERAHPFVWTKTSDQIPQESQPPNSLRRGALGVTVISENPPAANSWTRDNSGNDDCWAERE